MPPRSPDADAPAPEGLVPAVVGSAGLGVAAPTLDLATVSCGVLAGDTPDDEDAPSALLWLRQPRDAGPTAQSEPRN